jgi:hypothetical protein
VVAGCFCSLPPSVRSPYGIQRTTRHQPGQTGHQCRSFETGSNSRLWGRSSCSRYASASGSPRYRSASTCPSSRDTMTRDGIIGETNQRTALVRNCFVEVSLSGSYHAKGDLQFRDSHRPPLLPVEVRACPNNVLGQLASTLRLPDLPVATHCIEVELDGSTTKNGGARSTPPAAAPHPSTCAAPPPYSTAAAPSYSSAPAPSWHRAKIGASPSARPAPRRAGAGEP